MNPAFYIMVALTLTPCASPNKVCATSTVIGAYPSAEQCHDHLKADTPTTGYSCTLAGNESQQDKEMRDLFIGTAEKFLAIARESN